MAPDDELPPEFQRSKPEDGYKVSTTPLGNPPTQLVLSLYVMREGNLAGSDDDGLIHVQTVDQPTPRAVGDLVRLELVLAAVLRYFTTGGTWSQLDEALDCVRQLVPYQGSFLRGVCSRKQSPSGGVESRDTEDMGGPGWYLYDSYLNRDNAFEHIYARADESGDAVLWIEYLSPADPGGIVLTTLEQIRRDQEAAEARAGAAGAGVAPLPGPQNSAYP